MKFIKKYLETCISLFNFEHLKFSKFIFIVNSLILLISNSIFFVLGNNIIYNFLGFKSTNTNNPPTDGTIESLLWYLLSIVVVSPIIEEMIFRYPIYHNKGDHFLCSYEAWDPKNPEGDYYSSDSLCEETYGRSAIFRDGMCFSQD